jgi:hypothetical protein
MPAPDNSHSSPNRSGRLGRPISMLVIHATAGSLASAIAWLCSPPSKVSTHYIVSKRGLIFQLVPDDWAAWHAGRALWHGETAINEISLGIELENANDGRDPYPPVQLDSAVRLCREKCTAYQIAPDMVVRHLEVAIPKGRKTDPAGFPWAEFTARLFATSPQPAPPPPADPLRAHLIAGASRSYFAGSGFLDFYSTQGGLSLFGYPLTDEAHDTDLAGQACTWMRLERCVLKYKDGEGVHLALSVEAKAKGWI